MIKRLILLLLGGVLLVAVSAPITYAQQYSLSSSVVAGKQVLGCELISEEIFENGNCSTLYSQSICDFGGEPVLVTCVITACSDRDGFVIVTGGCF